MTSFRPPQHPNGRYSFGKKRVSITKQILNSSSIPLHTALHCVTALRSGMIETPTKNYMKGIALSRKYKYYSHLFVRREYHPLKAQTYPTRVGDRNDFVYNILQSYPVRDLFDPNRLVLAVFASTSESVRKEPLSVDCLIKCNL